MRSEQEMYGLILGFAEADQRVRAVLLNGSRANPNAPRDQYQDYDIVYVVRDFLSFQADEGWLDRFGERLILQKPEAMRDPCGDGSFNWMMLFTDGNRLDLTLLPVEKPALLAQDSLTVALLDKDGLLPAYPPASDRDYLVKPPDALYYRSCCNNFFWCLQNVAKGIARDELPYAMEMYHTVVLRELHDMLSWYIGVDTGFQVSAGKMGKYFKRYLPEDLYRRYLAVYSGADPLSFWAAIDSAAGLFHLAAAAVGASLGYPYRQDEEDGIRAYLRMLRSGV